MAFPVAGAMGIARHCWKRVSRLQTRILRFESQGVRWINDWAEVLFKWRPGFQVRESKRFLFGTINDRPIFVLSKNRIDQAVLDTGKTFIAEINSANGVLEGECTSRQP